MALKYPDNNNSFIPEATGQVIEIPLDKLDDFNHQTNDAVAKMAAEAGVVPPDAPMTEARPHGPGEPYCCAACGREFLTANTHEECLAEQQANFGGPTPGEKNLLVCHDCYRKILDFYHPGRS